MVKEQNGGDVKQLSYVYEKRGHALVGIQREFRNHRLFLTPTRILRINVKK